MTEQEIFDCIKNIIVENEDLEPRIPIEKIEYSTKFSEDMGFDSLAMMSLFYELQEKFPDLDESTAGNFSTIDSLVKDLK